jgi:hypothetical protein
VVEGRVRPSTNTHGTIPAATARSTLGIQRPAVAAGGAVIRAVMTLTVELQRFFCNEFSA